jgi:hypothetical protein
MIMRHGLPASAAITLAIGIAAPALAEVIPHRDDFVMNSIGGGDYRDYVLTYLDADDGLYVPMRTLGTLHNTMHQMMTELAIYARGDRDDEHVPDIGDRISGGDWTDYRKALEKTGEEGAWMDFVHVVEVMHDRVHHPMYKSVIYDFATMAREADLMDYVREPTSPDADELIPDRDQLNAAWIDLEAFRELAWGDEPEELSWRRVMQNAVVFGHLTDQLTGQWMVYAADHLDGACAPQLAGQATDEAWDAYVAHVRDCDDDGWRQLMLTHDLARLRIHQVLAHLAQHHRQS